MNILTKQELIKYLVCPICENKLELNDSVVKCVKCVREYKNNNGFVDFIIEEHLDEVNKQEIAGNITEKAILKHKGKLEYNKAKQYFTDKKIELVVKYLNDINCQLLCNCGAGIGFELNKILARYKPETVLVSDIQSSTLSYIPALLGKYDISLGVFLANFNNLPIINKSSDLVGLVYGSLHHTKDIHDSLYELLNKFSTLIIVEPVTNWFIEILAKFGLAKRKEYSGVNPSWLEIGKFKRIMKDRGYDYKIHMLIDLPDSLFFKNEFLCNIQLKLVDILSKICGKLQFGNFCVIMMSED